MLVVAEDARAQLALVATLAAHGLRAIRVGFTPLAVTRALGRRPDMILFDWKPPAFDGVTLTAKLRANTQVPIVVILAHPGEAVNGSILDAGASDYVLASLGSAELLARVRIWLRQVGRFNAAVLAPERTRERLRFDRERRILLVEGTEIHITPMECRLVTALVESPARALSEDHLIEALWSAGRAHQSQYLRTLIRHLRQKIERDPSRPAHLVGASGTGFRLKLG